jgi:hypothetical protein
MPSLIKESLNCLFINLDKSPLELSQDTIAILLINMVSIVAKKLVQLNRIVIRSEKPDELLKTNKEGWDKIKRTVIIN